MNKKLLLLAGILAVGAATFAADAAPVGDTTVEVSGKADGAISIKDDTAKDIKDTVDSEYLSDYLLADTTIKGVWTQTLKVNKEVSDNNNTNKRIIYTNNIGLNLTDNLSLSLHSDQEINQQHQRGSNQSGDDAFFSTELSYQNGKILGTDIESSQLFKYERDDDVIQNGEIYEFRQRFAFLDYLGDNGDTATVDFFAGVNRNNTKGKTNKNYGEIDANIAWKFGEEQKLGTLKPYFEADAYSSKAPSVAHSSDTFTFTSGLKYEVSRGNAKNTFGKLKFTGLVEDTINTNAHEFAGGLDGNHGWGYLEFALIYDNNLYTSKSGFTKLDFHADASIDPFVFDHNGHSKGGGDGVDTIVAASKTGNTIDNSIYLKLSQDLNKSLTASIEGGYESTIDTGETVRDIDKHDAGAYGRLQIKYTF